MKNGEQMCTMENSTEPSNLRFKALDKSKPTNYSTKEVKALNKQIEGIESNMLNWIMKHYNNERLPI